MNIGDRIPDVFGIDQHGNEIIKTKIHAEQILSEIKA